MCKHVRTCSGKKRYVPCLLNVNTNWFPLTNTFARAQVINLLLGQNYKENIIITMQ